MDIQESSREAMNVLWSPETERSFATHFELLPSDSFVTTDGSVSWDRIGEVKTQPVKTWCNRSYLAMLFPVTDGLALGRLTVQRTRASILLRPENRDDRSIGWEELHYVKNAIGFSEYWAVEIYPPVTDCANVSNMRHLWLVESDQVPFAWRASDGPNFFNNRGN